MKHTSEGLARTIERLRQLEAAATPGPWSKAYREVYIWPEGRISDVVICRSDREADAAFITEMRNALPALLQELEQRDVRIEALLDRLEKCEAENTLLRAVAEAAEEYFHDDVGKFSPKYFPKRTKVQDALAALNKEINND